MNNITVSDLRKLEVVVLGDVMLDRFVYGSVGRVSPEAPIPVLLFERESAALGGAGNVARNVAALGGCPVLIGAIGGDKNGAFVSGQLAGESDITTRLAVVADWPTTVKTRFVCGTHQLMRLDVESRLLLDQKVQDTILEQLVKSLASAKVLVLSDYGKGLLTPAIVSGAISAARVAGVQVLIDPKVKDLSVYAGAQLVTPNANEAELATGVDCHSNDGAAEAAKRIYATSGISTVLITRGAQGMTLYGPDTGVPDPIHISTAASEVFDVSGAGDTVVATLALFLAAGENMETAARMANLAAGIVVGKAGTASVHAEELAQAISSTRLHKSIVPHTMAVVRAAEWRAAGLTVGFANGCFDLIHPGHVRLLEKAKAACDRLIVALNSDASVQRLKGPARPVQNEAARAVVMAAIRSVDLVTHFDEDTPLRLIEELRPDVLIKGADYQLSQVVGADLVQSWGGKIALIPLEEGNSTSNIILRAKTDATSGKT